MSELPDGLRDVILTLHALDPPSIDVDPLDALLQCPVNPGLISGREKFLYFLGFLEGRKLMKKKMKSET